MTLLFIIKIKKKKKVINNPEEQKFKSLINTIIKACEQGLAHEVLRSLRMLYKYREKDKEIEDAIRLLEDNLYGHKKNDLVPILATIKNIVKNIQSSKGAGEPLPALYPF
jgi:hypothetical protein